MKKSGIAILILLVVLGGLFLAKNMIIKTALKTGVKAATGLKVDIDSLKVGLVKSLIDIEGLIISNPPEFSDKTMVNMPKIYVDYDLSDLLFGKKVHLTKAVLNLQELLIVKNSQGELNLNSLKVVKKQTGAKKEAGDKKEKKMPQVRIDTLQLKIGKVVYIDRSNQGTVSRKEFKINLDETYTDITNVNTLSSLILVKALANTTIGNLIDLDLGNLKENLTQGLGSTVGQTKQMATEAAEGVKATTEKTVDQTKDAAKDVIDNTSETLKDINPFDNN